MGMSCQELCLFEKSPFVTGVGSPRPGLDMIAQGVSVGNLILAIQVTVTFHFCVSSLSKSANID